MHLVGFIHEHSASACSAAQRCRLPASQRVLSLTQPLRLAVVSCQAAALHAAIRDVCRLASEVEADAERFPQDWLFHYR